MTHTQQQLYRLLQAILSDPSDDDRRSIYADALEEAGHEERGEFIRVQVALAKTPEWTVLGRSSDAPNASTLSIKNEAWQKLKDREQALLFNTIFWVADWPQPAHPDKGNLVWRRGFIAEVKCDGTIWVHHGPDLIREHPVERVTIENRYEDEFESRTYSHDGNTSEWVLDSNRITIELRPFFDPPRRQNNLLIYPSRHESIDDYSSACLKFAKSRSAI